MLQDNYSLNREDRYIVHLLQPDGEPLFLHPFVRRKSTLRISGFMKIVGLYGTQPHVDALQKLYDALYTRMEKDVSLWIVDKKFVSHFIVTGLVFLATYFITSFFIRDPLPVLDELAISFGVSLLVLFTLRKRANLLQEAGQRRMRLRMIIDKVEFNPSSFVVAIEHYIYSYKEALDHIETPPLPQFSDTTLMANWGIVRDIVDYMEISHRPLIHVQRKLARAMKKSSDAVEHILRNVNERAHALLILHVYFKQWLQQSKTTRKKNPTIDLK